MNEYNTIIDLAFANTADKSITKLVEGWLVSWSFFLLYLSLILIEHK